MKPIRHIAILMILSLSACSVLPEAEHLRLFSLPYERASSLSGTDSSIPLTLRLHSPQASRVLGGTRIVVLPDGNEMSSYSGARWSDRAPRLLRDRLMEAFLQQGGLEAVIDDENRLPADLALAGSLHAFQSEYVEGKPQVRILLDLRLTGDNGRRLVAARRFQVSEPSRNKNIESVVASFGRASDQLSAEVVEWASAAIGDYYHGGAGESAAGSQ